MPRFITIHRAPGLRQEDFAENAPAVYEGTHATMVQNFVNLGDGFIVTVYDADSADALEEEFERLGFPVDETHEIQFSQTHEELGEMLKQMGGG